MQVQIKATALSCFDCSKSLQLFARKYASSTFASKSKTQIFWTKQSPNLPHVLPRAFALENLSKSRTKISISRTEQISSPRSIKSFSYDSRSTISTPSFLNFTLDVRKYPKIQVSSFLYSVKISYGSLAVSRVSTKSLIWTQSQRNPTKATIQINKTVILK